MYIKYIPLCNGWHSVCIVLVLLYAIYSCNQLHTKPKINLNLFSAIRSVPRNQSNDLRLNSIKNLFLVTANFPAKDSSFFFLEECNPADSRGRGGTKLGPWIWICGIHRFIVGWD